MVTSQSYPGQFIVWSVIGAAILPGRVLNQSGLECILALVAEVQPTHLTRLPCKRAVVWFPEEIGEEPRDRNCPKLKFILHIKAHLVLAYSELRLPYLARRQNQAKTPIFQNSSRSLFTD
jgi:hypothetical protein